MPNLMRSRIALSGWPGGPGVITVYWSTGTLGTDALPAQIQAFHEELIKPVSLNKSMYRNGFHAEVEVGVDVIDVATGKIIDFRSAEGAVTSTVSGLTGGSAPTSAMACVNLLTDKFINGRRLRGRHFWGPIGGEAVDQDGTLGATATANLEDAYIAPTSGAGPRIAVYHRPTANGASDGQYADVVAVKVKPLIAVLRSRRD